MHLHVSMSVRGYIVLFTLLTAFAFVAFKKVDSQQLFASSDAHHVR